MALVEDSLKGLFVGGSGGGKSGGGAPKQAKEASDTLHSNAVIEIVEIISEGEIEGWAGADAESSVYFDGTPLKTGSTYNFEGVSIDYRAGTQDQLALLGQIDNGNPATPYSVEQQVKKATPVVKTVNNADIDEVRVTISIPALYEQDKSNGNIIPASVEIGISVQAYGQPDYSPVDLNGRQVISGKASSAYNRTYRFDLRQFGDAPYNIRVERVTEDSTSLALINETHWASYSEITRAKLRYPNSASVRISANAEQFSAIPVRGYLVYGVKVQIPTAYNPVTRTYLGEWDGTFTTAWTNNPAWIFYDLISDTRYGLGSRIPEALRDKWTLYSIAQYCDESVPDGFGGYEPRFTCNTYLQTAREAHTVVSELASIFRGMVYWGTGGVVPVQDRPTSPTMQYTRSNVVDGKFSYSGSPGDTRYTTALVGWSNPDNQYKREIEYVEDPDGIARYGLLPTEVVAVGCTSRGQANRVGKAILLTSRLEYDTVTFGVGLDSQAVAPGQVILVADPKRTPGMAGGRLMSNGEVSSAVLDRDVTLDPATTYLLTVTLADSVTDEVSVEEVTVTTAAGTYAAGESISFTPALTLPPVKYAVWSLRPSTVANTAYRVISVTGSDNPAEDGFFTVVATLYAEEKYDLIDSDAQLESLPPGDPTTSTGVAPPTNLSIEEGVSVEGTAQNRFLDVSWTEALGSPAAYFLVRWIPPSGELNETKVIGPSIRLNYLIPGDYSFKVHAVDALGRLSLPLEGDYTMAREGKHALKPASGLELVGTGKKRKGNGTEFAGRDASFTWRRTAVVRSYELGEEPLGAGDGTVDPWLQDYEVRIYAGTDITVNPVRTEHVVVTKYTYTFEKNVSDGGPFRQFTIMVLARDQYNRLTDPAVLTVSNPAPANPTAISYATGFNSFTVLFTPPTDPDYKEMRLYVSDTPGFTPGPTNLAVTSPGSSIGVEGLSGTTFYARLESVDEFGPSGTYTDELAVAVNTPDAVLNELAGAITETQLHTDLLAEIHSGSGINTYYQATEPTGGTYSVGDLWFDTDDNNNPYRYNGTAWVSVRDTSATGVTTYYQTSAPATGAEGDLWFDTDDGNKVYRHTGGSWVSAQDDAINTALTNASNAQTTADGKIETFYQTTAPAGGAEGDFWIDTDDGNKLYRHTSGSWVAIQDQGIQNALTAAGDAQSTADGKIVSYFATSAPGGGSVGDLWFDTDDNNHPYRHNGSTWVSVRDTSVTGIATYYQDTEPTGGSYSAGDLWFDTDDGNHPYRYDGAVWQSVSDASASGVRTFIQPTAPAFGTHAEGDLWFDSDDLNHPYRSNGTIWVDIQDGWAAAAVAAESSIRETADGLLNAEYTIKADYNGHVAGMGVAVSGGASGPVESNIIMMADRFAVSLPAGDWQASMSYTLGQYVKPSAAWVEANSNLGLYYKALNAGATGATEPNWNDAAAVSSTLVDGTITWKAVSVTSTVPFVVGTVGGQSVVTMDNAFIQDAAITTAKIGDLQVNTLKIQDDAVTVSVAGSGSATIVSSGNPISIFAASYGLSYVYNDGAVREVTVTLSRNGTPITSRLINGVCRDYYRTLPAIFVIRDVQPAGTYTYQLSLSSSAVFNSYAPGMILSEVKK